MSLNPITIRNLGPEDAHILDRARPGTLRGDFDPSRVWSFLATRVNDLVVALDRGEVIGFASGTMLMHPDMGTEFVVNEVSVHSDYRRKGVATRLLQRISELALDRGCEAIRLVTEAENEAAAGLCRKLGASAATGVAIYTWDGLNG